MKNKRKDQPHNWPDLMTPQLAEEGGDPKALEGEVADILEQMGHTQELGVIRQFAFVLPKIMKKIYRKILINEDGIEKVKVLVSLICLLVCVDGE